jgi:hypothetical protein
MLILYGTPATQAAAAVLVYHTIAFWIPSLGGLVGYWRLRCRLRGAATDAPCAARTRPSPAHTVGLVQAEPCRVGLRRAGGGLADDPPRRALEHVHGRAERGQAMELDHIRDEHRDASPCVASPHARTAVKLSAWPPPPRPARVRATRARPVKRT